MPYAKKEDQYRNQTLRWRKIKQKAIDYKGGKCIVCGYNGHIAALQFHHADPSTKETVWNTLRGRPWDKIVLELDKCELLCANCHAITHAVSKYDGLIV